ncbi:unnamed protein product [Fraxinus pennsylvanica]|uniref:Uncharacterized protein n=1 Tax=Fraxinus pennsylvanica TaxID=56036 RepID=A0AAD2EDG1_9LAMI|nr:unnamed protein product [Fraxinus pennsylvanica]
MKLAEAEAESESGGKRNEEKIRDNAVRGMEELQCKISEIDNSLEKMHGEIQIMEKKEYQGVLAGKSSGNEDKCLEDQLGDAKIEVGRTETELKQLQTRISHCEKEWKEKSSQLLSKRKEAVAGENELNVRRKDVEKAQKALESLSCEECHMEALQKDCAAKVEMVQKFKDEMRILSLQLGNVDFSYIDHAKNFDRSRVKGMVARLIKVKDSSGMTALEPSCPTESKLLRLDWLAKAMLKWHSLVGCDEELQVAFNRRRPSATFEGDIF